jgi:histidyl-tRNA synthetase
VKFRSIKGTKDILPAESAAWQSVEGVVRTVMADFNYREIRTPVFEQTSLFARSIGELTDIVSKEMYSFLDRGEDSITLRPEGTASTLRAYIQNNLAEQSPMVKLYYLGPMFRQERPQAGRLRQFHQFGAEAIGSTSPQLDVEIIAIPIEIYRRLGISDSRLKINSVGCEKCRPTYKELLTIFLLNLKDRLSPESHLRIQSNPLRVLDSKDENDIRLTATAPLIKDYLCQECRTHFDEVRRLLGAINLSHEIDGRLVRGLDYYTKTAFEVTSASLGSQDALAGGGRYDLLVAELGGKPTPGVGFAAGLERLLIVLDKLGKNNFIETSPDLYLVSLDEATRQWAFVKAMELRGKGMRVELDYLSRSIKAQMRDANRQSARYVLVVGEQELKSGRGKLKQMSSGTETEISLENIAVPQ